MNKPKRVKLTKGNLHKLKPPESGHTLYWDIDLKGFGARITKTGKITYIVLGRVQGRPNDNAIQFSIGAHPVYTPYEAREAAREHLQNMRKGVDPRQVKKEAAAASVTLREVADKYIDERPLKDSSKDAIEGHVTTSFKEWLNKPIASISREDVTARFNEIRKHGLLGNGPAPQQANQAFIILRALINYAQREYRKADGTPLLADNPVSVLTGKWASSNARDSFIPDNKVGAVWHALAGAWDAAYTRNTLTSIKLVQFLMLTGARIGEASSVRWENVDLEQGTWHIPDPKNKRPITLPLSTVAVELLTTMRRVKGNPHLFPSNSKRGHISDPRGVMEKVSAVAGLHLSPHDLRRTFTSLGAITCGIEIYKMELLTNHVPQSITLKHYMRTSDLKYMQPEVQKIADHIIEQAAIAAGENVVVLDTKNSAM